MPDAEDGVAAAMAGSARVHACVENINNNMAEIKEAAVKSKDAASAATNQVGTAIAGFTADINVLKQSRAAIRADLWRGTPKASGNKSALSPSPLLSVR